MKRTGRFMATAAAILIIFWSAAVLAGEDGSLSPKTLKRFRAALEMDAPTRAAYNAVTAGDAKELAIDRDILRRHNTVFSHTIKTKGITNQKKSGRCWLFAGLNVMRPTVIATRNLADFQFSQNYLAFCDKLEKANCFLETMIEMADRDPLDREMELILKQPFYEGGWWNYVVELIEKYGAVPQSVMPETHSSENSHLMHAVIGRKLKSDALALRKMHAEGKTVTQLRAAKKEMLAEVYRMLVINLGRPPEKFQWRWVDKDGKVGPRHTYTPKSFYKKVVGVDLRQYVSLYNDPTQPPGKHYRLRLSKNLYDGEEMHYANCEIDVLKGAALESVLDDQPVWFAADVGRDQSSTAGIMAAGLYDFDSLYGTEIGRMTKAERMLWHEGSSNHAMVFVGVDVCDGKPVKWKVENSWGEERGSKGFWTLYDSWFNENVYEVIVKKEYVPKKVLDIFQQKPIELPPWYPTARRFR